MQERQLNRALYFREFATTNENYFIPYIRTYKPLTTGMNILEIKRTRTSIELFERLSRRVGAHIQNRTLYFINPHYEVKFKLKPRRLAHWLAAIPGLHNFFTTSCFYILKF